MTLQELALAAAHHRNAAAAAAEAERVAAFRRDVAETLHDDREAVREHFARVITTKVELANDQIRPLDGYAEAVRIRNSLRILDVQLDADVTLVASIHPADRGVNLHWNKPTGGTMAVRSLAQLGDVYYQHALLPS